MRLPPARWLTPAVLAAAPAAAQAPGPPPPPGAVFRPLLAHPKEPQFFAAYLWEPSPSPPPARAAPRPPAPPPPPGGFSRPPRPAPRGPLFLAPSRGGRPPRLAPRLGGVGFGQTIGVVTGRSWRVAIAAAVFSQFNTP